MAERNIRKNTMLPNKISTNSLLELINYFCMEQRFKFWTIAPFGSMLEIPV